MGARQVIVEGSLKAQSIRYKVSIYYDMSVITYKDPKLSANPSFPLQG